MISRLEDTVVVLVRYLFGIYDCSGLNKLPSIPSIPPSQVSIPSIPPSQVSIPSIPPSQVVDHSNKVAANLFITHLQRNVTSRHILAGEDN